ncbi:hypothetical protein FACS189481_3980 [Clostridia bacterium]|nr:hypothetical protein FACS189481_3980 [Clostridia bacterium]
MTKSKKVFNTNSVMKVIVKMTESKKSVIICILPYEENGVNGFVMGIIRDLVSRGKDEFNAAKVRNEHFLYTIRRILILLLNRNTMCISLH